MGLAMDDAHGAAGLVHGGLGLQEDAEAGGGEVVDARHVEYKLLCAVGVEVGGELGCGGGVDAAVEGVGE